MKPERMENIEQGISNDEVISAELSDEEKFSLVGQQKELLGEIKDNINKIDEIIQRVLDFAKPQGVSSARVEVNSLVRDMVKLWASRFRKLELSHKISLAPGALPVQADSIGVQQVLNNLILNATEAMEEGGLVQITTSHERSSLLKGREVAVIQVRDDGPGIRPGLMESIFNPFFTTKATGTGLGLAISYQIIERHGGLLSVESEPGQCTVFRIELPIIQDDNE